MNNGIYMVIGLGKSGIALAEHLHSHSMNVVAYDKKPSEEALARLTPKMKVLSGDLDCNWLDGVCELVMSPGVPTKIPFVEKAKELGISVIGEIEFAYRYCKGNIIAITGTNGKTTTTTLTGEILKNAGYNTHVVGNIGNVFIKQTELINEGDAVVAEISSYQLETIDKFKPVIASVLNVTPDHLSRHGSMEAYTQAKFDCFKNMDNAYAVLNADNAITANASVGTNKPYYFSIQKALDEGAWLENGDLVLCIDGVKEHICKASELKILGSHNIENALAASLLARLYGANIEAIRDTLINFYGVEHRIEYSGEVNGIKFYNDSKGTNCDSTIKAIDAMPSKTALILGGYDKGGTFDELFECIDDRIKAITVIGETADLIIKTAEKFGYKNIIRCQTFEESIRKAFIECESGDNVLLSPACASWDMFDNFEQRGEIFKDIAKQIINENK